MIQQSLKSFGTLKTQVPFVTLNSSHPLALTLPRFIQGGMKFRPNSTRPVEDRTRALWVLRWSFFSRIFPVSSPRPCITRILSPSRKFNSCRRKALKFRYQLSSRTVREILRDDLWLMSSKLIIFTPKNLMDNLRRFVRAYPEGVRFTARGPVVS